MKSKDLWASSSHRSFLLIGSHSIRLLPRKYVSSNVGYHGPVKISNDSTEKKDTDHDNECNQNKYERIFNKPLALEFLGYHWLHLLSEKI
jgi:hypothetical protein